MSYFNLLVRLISLFFLMYLFSCKLSQERKDIENAHLRIFERIDHQKCVEKNMDISDDNISNQFYWICRKKLLEARLIDFPKITPSIINNNRIIKNAIKEIDKNISRSYNYVISKLSDDINIDDHNKCISRSFKENTVNYYKCREKLVESRIPSPPKMTHLYEYANNKNKEINTLERFLLTKYNKNDVSKTIPFKINQLLMQYPLCSKFNYKDRIFDNCIDKNKEKDFCLNNIAISLSRKIFEEKSKCQAKADIQFATNDKQIESKEEKQNRIAKEIEKNINLQFFAQNTITPRYLQEDINNEINKREKIESLKLKEEFIKICINDIDQNKYNFQNELKNNCNDLIKDFL